MFANFELCEDLLIKVPPPRRHSRSATGCLQCRKRKRKCDEQKPVCKSCLKYGSDCSLARSSSSPGNSCSRSPRSRHSSPKATQTTRLSTFSQESPAESTSSEYSTLSLSRKKREPSEEIGQHLLQLRSASFHPLLKTLESPFSKIFSRPEEQRSFQSLITRFHPMVTLSYANPERSILGNALPLAFEYKSIRTGFIACGLALVFRGSGKLADQESALKYYNETVNTISGDLMSLPTEPNLAAVLLLHLFEDICSDSVHRKQVHLRGAETLIATAMKREHAWSSHMILLLEAYIYHTVTSGILGGLAWQSTLSDDHISNLLEALHKISEKFIPGPLWKSGALLGVSHDLFDIAFRISQLRERLPLQASDQLKAEQSQHRLTNWHAPMPFDNGSFQQPPTEMLLGAELYRLSCQLLLAKITTPSLTSSDRSAREIMHKSVEIMNDMPMEDFDTFILHWPVIILGSGAVTVAEQTLFRSSYERDIQAGGFGYLIRVSDHLKYAWSFDHNLGRQIGLDALIPKDHYT